MYGPRGRSLTADLLAAGRCEPGLAVPVLYPFFAFWTENGGYCRTNAAYWALLYTSIPVCGMGVKGKNRFFRGEAVGTARDGKWADGQVRWKGWAGEDEVEGCSDFGGFRCCR